MLGIGLDLLELCRMERPLHNLRFLERVFTAKEYAWLIGKGFVSRDVTQETPATIPASALASAAGLFCAKEAVSKALGINLLSIPMSAIEIDHTPAGQPVAVLHPPLQAKGRMQLSITHSRQTAAAVAVWMPE